MSHFQIRMRDAALIAIALLGCSSKPSTPPPPAELVAMKCDPRIGGDNDPIHELRARGKRLALAIPVDYLAVKRVVPWEMGPLTYAERGRPCAGAADESACQKALLELEKRSAPAPVPCPAELACPERMYVITTHGATPQLWSSAEQLRQLLGPIDTADDAWLIAQAAEHLPPYSCADVETSAVRVVAGGYELRMRQCTKNCEPIEYTEHTYRVDRDGTVHHLGTRIVSSEPGCVTG
jgi:hypothetical protein